MKRHVASDRRKPTALPGAKKATGLAGLKLDQLIALWRLYRGGIPLAEATALVGVKLHGSAARSAVETFDGLMTSQHMLSGYVRCGGCGALLIEIPCVLCGCRRDSYKLTRKDRC